MKQLNTPTVDDLELWKAKKDCSANWGSTLTSPVNERRISIEKGEMVEFRFRSPIHFRTIDDIWLLLEEKEFYECFEPHGKIHEKIKTNNIATLKEILKLQLFEKHISSEVKP